MVTPMVPHSPDPRAMRKKIGLHVPSVNSWGLLVLRERLGIRDMIEPIKVPVLFSPVATAWGMGSGFGSAVARPMSARVVRSFIFARTQIPSRRSDKN